MIQFDVIMQTGKSLKNKNGAHIPSHAYCNAGRPGDKELDTVTNNLYVGIYYVGYRQLIGIFLFIPARNKATGAL